MQLVIHNTAETVVRNIGRADRRKFLSSKKAKKLGLDYEEHGCRTANEAPNPDFTEDLVDGFAGMNL